MARLAGAGIAAAAAAFAACFSTPSFHEPSDAHSDAVGGDDDATTDAYINVDGNSNACTFDTFDITAGGCGNSDWAPTPQLMNGNANAAGGELTLQVTGSGISWARCQSVPLAYSRFTVDVTSAAQGSNGDTTFVGLDNGTARFGVQFTWDSLDGVPGAKVVCGGGPTATASALPTDMRFVRVEVTATSGVRIASSPDGASFNKQIGTCTPGAPAVASTAATLSLDRTSGSGASVPMSQFGSIELCR